MKKRIVAILIFIIGVCLLAKQEKDSFQEVAENKARQEKVEFINPEHEEKKFKEDWQTTTNFKLASSNNDLVRDTSNNLVWMRSHDYPQLNQS